MMPGDMETEILLENRELFEKRPACWEFILTVDRLERPLEEIIREADGIAPISSSAHASALASAELMQKNMALISSSIEALCPLMESRLIESWGPPGQKGVVAEIERVCREILSRCKELADAEHEILTTPMHPKLAEAQAKFQGLASENISRILQIIKSIRNFIAAGSTGQLNLNVQFTTNRLAGIVIPDLGFAPSARANSYCQTSGPRRPPVPQMQPPSATNSGCLNSLNMFFGWVFLLLGMFFIWLYWPFGLGCLFFSLLCFGSVDSSG